MNQYTTIDDCIRCRGCESLQDTPCPPWCEYATVDATTLCDAIDRERQAVHLWRITPPSDPYQRFRAHAALHAEQRTDAVVRRIKKDQGDTQ